MLLIGFWFFPGLPTTTPTVSQETTDNPVLFFSGGDLPCEPDQKTALLIFGEEPEDYQSRQRTIQSLVAVLKSANYPEERITILTNGNSDSRLRANRENILRELDGVLNASPQTEDAKDRELFIYASLKMVVPEDVPCLVCPSNVRTLDELLIANNTDIQYKPDHLIDLQGEFLEPISQSPIERRLLVFNTISPRPQTRGGVTIRERGVSHAKLASATRGNKNSETRDAVSQAFGQIIISDSLRPGPGTVNSFVDILEKGMLGYADSTDTGNLDGKVEMNELLAYLEEYTFRFHGRNARSHGAGF